MIRLATTLVAALAIATPAAAQFNIFSPAPLAGEDWVGVKATKTNARLTAEPAARAARPAPAAPAPAPAAAPIAEAAPKGPRLSALSSPAQAEQPAAGPALKREVIVTGELVRIGDLVENAGAVAEVAIFRAPTSARPAACRHGGSPRRCGRTRSSGSIPAALKRSR